MNLVTDQSENPGEKSKKIYRIMPFQRLVELLVNNENTLVKPSNWNDPLERLIARKIHSKSDERFRDYELCRFFGQCWTLKPASNAMWSIYSNLTDGIRIRTTVGQLWNSIEDSKDVQSYIGKVVYKNITKFGENNDILQCVEKELSKNNGIDRGFDDLHDFNLLAKAHMYKRKAFTYENEVRLICHVREDDKNNQKELYRYHICPNKLIDQIMTHPSVKGDNFEKLKETLGNLGFEKDIEQSRYLEVPNWLKDVQT